MRKKSLLIVLLAMLFIAGIAAANDTVVINDDLVATVEPNEGLPTEDDEIETEAPELINEGSTIRRGTINQIKYNAPAMIISKAVTETEIECPLLAYPSPEYEASCRRKGGSVQTTYNKQGCPAYQCVKLPDRDIVKVEVGDNFKLEKWDIAVFDSGEQVVLEGITQFKCASDEDELNGVAVKCIGADPKAKVTVVSESAKYRVFLEAGESVKIKGSNIQITVLEIDDDSVVFTSDESEEEPLVCIQVIVYAVNEEGECEAFSTPCDIPPGWKRVGGCAVTLPGGETLQGQTFKLSVGEKAMVLDRIAVTLLEITESESTVKCEEDGECKEYPGVPIAKISVENLRSSQRMASVVTIYYMRQGVSINVFGVKLHLDELLDEAAVFSASMGKPIPIVIGKGTIKVIAHPKEAREKAKLSVGETAELEKFPVKIFLEAIETKCEDTEEIINETETLECTKTSIVAVGTFTFKDEAEGFLLEQGQSKTIEDVTIRLLYIDNETAVFTIYNASEYVLPELKSAKIKKLSIGGAVRGIRAEIETDDGSVIREFEEELEPSVEVEVETEAGSVDVNILHYPERREIRIRHRNIEAKVEKELEIEEKNIYIKTERVKKQMRVMPSKAVERMHEAIRGVTIKETVLDVKEDKPMYSVEGEKDVRILIIIPAKMQVRAEINAETGTVERIEKPWWSFFAGE